MHSYYEVTLFQVAFLLAFFGAFRCSELVARSKRDRSGRAIEVSDVSVREAKLHLQLQRYKMDQLARGHRITLHAAKKGTPCPIQCVKEFIAFRPDHGGPLFIHRDSLYLSHFQFISIFRACISKAGLPVWGFRGHSFRIRATTAGAELSFSSEWIKTIGKWQSAAFKSYMHPGGTQ